LKAFYIANCLYLDRSIFLAIVAKRVDLNRNA
jgi:hypothetical protein